MLSPVSNSGSTSASGVSILASLDSGETGDTVCALSGGCLYSLILVD